MSKVFAVLAVLLVVGCADVGEDDGAEGDTSAVNEKNRAARLAAQADAGPELVAPYDDEPALEQPRADAGAALILEPKTGGDAAVAPVLPVADAGAVSDPEPDPEVTPEPAPDAGVRPYFLDGRTVSLKEAGRTGALPRLLSFRINPANAQSAFVTVYDRELHELGKGTAALISQGKWHCSGGSFDGTYGFQITLFTDDLTEKLLPGALVREGAEDWASPRANLQPL